MKRNKTWIIGLAIAAVAMIGLTTEAQAQPGSSYTQPAAELVAPYDTMSGKVSFIVASNTSDRDVSTQWTFWNEACDAEAEISICMPQNDTVIVDPRNMQGLDADNNPVGDPVSLDGVRGVATVVAYEAVGDCAPYPESNVIADHTIVGAFTFADTDIGYSFGNDALGLGTDKGANPAVQVPEPGPGNIFEWAVQVFKPADVETSVVVLTHLAETAEGQVVPGKPVVTFATSVVDTYEVPTSLPDTEVSCTTFFTVADGVNPLIPDATTLDSSGMVRLQPTSGLVPGTTYVHGIIGQAVLDWGASSSVKVEEVED